MPCPDPVKSLGENVALWIQAIAAIVAVLVAGLALLFNVMPWCDMADVEVRKQNGSVRLESKVKNTGRGQAFNVRIWLLEYGNVENLPDSRGYIGLVSPDTELPYRSAEISLGGRPPANDRYRVLLTWDAVFGLCSGEAYVEEHYGHQSYRPRVKLLYPWTRIWRTITQYDLRGRK